MRRQKHSDTTLGISVTPNRVESVLLRRSDQRFEIVGRFTRPRTKTSEPVATGSLATVLPGVGNGSEADFTIHVGDGGSTPETFLAGEFVGLGTKLDVEGKQRPSSPQRSTPFVQQLKEILAECGTLGHENPNVAFCIGAPDVSYVELTLARDQKDTARKTWWPPLKNGSDQTVPGADRRRLLELLAAQHQSPFDPARVAFVPMTPLRGQHRYLAIVPESNEPVAATLNAMRRQQRAHVPSSRMLGTEVSLYAALARKTLAPTDLENTAVVRIGSEDTLILFLAGTQLRHLERLRSLTTYDPPETICSRVLLQQDEQKIGEIHQVLILSEGHTEPFLDAFRKFYPNASVESMQRAVLDRGADAMAPEMDQRPTSVPAIGIGLNLLETWEKDTPFDVINLLPKKLRQKPRQQLAYAWHTFVMLIALFPIVFFLTMRYAEQQAEIDRSRAEMQLLNIPNPTMGTSTALQTRVDSLKGAYQTYTDALQVLDSLLVGSDQWTRTLEKTSRATRDLEGVWFESWQPVGASIRVSGYARSRESVARLAYLLGGAIHETSFADVNDVRLHPFMMLVPRPIGTPMIVDYLRETALAAPEERTSSASGASQGVSGDSLNQQNQ